MYQLKQLALDQMHKTILLLNARLSFVYGNDEIGCSTEFRRGKLPGISPS